MQRTNVFELKPTKKQEKVLKEMCLLSAAVFNIANYNFRQAIFKKEPVKSFYKQWQTIQNKEDYQKLGRSYAQPMLQKHSELVTAFFGKLRNKKPDEEVGLPKYYKNRKTNTTLPAYLLMNNSQYYFRGRKIFLPLGRKMRKQTGLKKLDVKFNGNQKWVGKQCRGEIHYNKTTKKWYFHQAIEIKDPIKREQGKSVAIDLGIKRFITAFDGEKQKMYPNVVYDKWKKINQRISILQQIAKGRNNRYTTNQIQRLYLNRSRLMDNHFKDISLNLVETYPDASEIIIGNITGIRENSDSGSKIANAMAHNHWSYAKLLKRIENKAEEKGIKTRYISEAYTSQICPNCKTKNKPIDREYKCKKCGFVGDRDIVGATNIYHRGRQAKTCLPFVGEGT